MPDQPRRDTLARQWELLRLLPSHPPGRTAAELTRLLDDAGFPTTKRTVERDLKELEQVFPFTCNDKGMPFGWHWIRDADLGIPGVELAEALSLTLLRDFLQQMLPVSLWRGFAPRLKYAHKKLQTLAGHNSAARWRDKARFVTPTLPLIPPTIDEAVLDTVQHALLDNRQLEVRYRGAGDMAVKPLTLHPLGIIQRGPVGYLIATAFDYADIRFYALHRIRKADRLSDTVRRPAGFSLDDYLATGAGQFSMAKPNREIRLRAIIDPDLAHILEETALSKDMHLRETGEDFLLTATMVDTWQLRWWILSQGAAIEVLKPKALRQAIAGEIAELHAVYSATG